MRWLLGVLFVSMTAGCLRAEDHEGGWPCTAHGDCLLGEKCVGRTCVPESYCDYTSDCTPDQICSAHTCVKPECSNDSDCKAGMTCRLFRCAAGAAP